MSFAQDAGSWSGKKEKTGKGPEEEAGKKQVRKCFVGNLIPLVVNFIPLVGNFIPLVVNFIPLVVNFIPLVVNFIPLVGNFISPVH